jgi:hypothetical protein
VGCNDEAARREEWVTTAHGTKPYALDGYIR